ncbi:MAG: hypothetical protein PHW52_04570, partial [Candidatus Pacebacteria bacterium]|nr:hypothetical protein [Candidatus Paceibacterota bacterium]
GKSSPIIGNYQVQKSLLTGVRSLNNSGDGDKTITTAYATIPVEYVEVNGDTTYSSTPTIGNSTADARMLALRYIGNLTINSGVTLTPQVRKRGMFLYVDDTLTLNGIISMTARGAANVAGDRILILTDGGTSYEIPAVGNSGGNGQTGAGGAGAWYGGAGAAGTSYSGGSGGGGDRGGAGAANGGAGGKGTGNGTGGAGNPGGSGISSGANGTGGLLIVYAKTIIVSSTGSIKSSGSSGGSAGGSQSNGGGGSGGGSINIFYQNTFTNSGSIAANGGSGGSAGRNGSSGGVGTVRSYQVTN